MTPPKKIHVNNTREHDKCFSLLLTIHEMCLFRPVKSSIVSTHHTLENKQE
jgi:hypothetical protein